MPKPAADIECVYSWLGVRSWHGEYMHESALGTLCQHTHKGMKITWVLFYLVHNMFVDPLGIRIPDDRR